MTSPRRRVPRVRAPLWLPALALAAITGCDAPLEEQRARALEARGRSLFDQTLRTHQYFDAFKTAEQFFQRHEDPDRVLDALALTPGQTVADVGCGVGYYTVALARAVGPAGTVHALDTQAASIELLRSRLQVAEFNPHDNVVARVSSVDDIGVESAALDAALMVHLDWHAYPQLLDENRAMLASCLRALRPGGRLVVVQFHGFLGEGGSCDHTADHLAAAGFVELERSHDPRRDTSYLVYERPVDGVDGVDGGG